jgi:MFS-type transporter involved in bile tolerance (Atg22 family)
MTPQPSKDSTAFAGVLAVAMPAAMFLSMAVSPMFMLAFPLLLGMMASKSGSKKDAIAAFVAFLLCGGLLVMMGAYTLGKTMAERDNAMSCPAKTEISPQ